jgi:hypothetical protein
MIVGYILRDKETKEFFSGNSMYQSYMFSNDGTKAKIWRTDKKTNILGCIHKYIDYINRELEIIPIKAGV